MEKIWLPHYPKEVPEFIHPDTYRSLVDMLDKSCTEFHDRPAFYNLGTTLTFGQLDKYANAFAAYLRHRLKLKKGERIAMMLPNILQYPVAVLGALRAGLIVVNVNPLYTAAELIHQLNDSEAKTILVLDHVAHTVEKALPHISVKHIIVTKIGDLLPPLKATVMHFILKYIRKKIPPFTLPHLMDFKKALSSGKKYSFSPASLTHHDIAFLQYTGGTTGISKGAMLTHRNIIANILQAEAWLKSTLVPEKEIMITALPLYHIFSLLANFLFMTKIGGLSVLITNPMNTDSMVADIAKFPFTAITGVNTLFNALLKNPLFLRLDFSHLHLSLGGGMAVQSTTAKKWQSVTGVTLLEAYGLTETSPCISINPPNIKTYNGSVGLPISSTRVCIMDEVGHMLPEGQQGEIAVKGPQVMWGYWKNPEETKKVFTVDGWFLTGDIAFLDEKGFIHIVDRKKDMILVSGFNVYPNEIEEVLTRLAGISEAAVIGVPDEITGEKIKAFIVKNNPELTKEAVLIHCQETLTKYKIPKEIVFCESLPKTQVGKISRRLLRTEQAATT